MPDARGDPMSSLRWTCKSLRRLAAELNKLGHQISHTVVGELLKAQKFSLQANYSRVLAQPSGAHDARRATMTRDTQLATAPLLGVILVRDRLDMHLAMEAGRAWQRLHLGATAEGLAAQPLNQPVECIDRSAMVGKNDSFGPAIVKLAATPGWEPTFVFR
jgi:Rhodopirellula transposase DDE domain